MYVYFVGTTIALKDLRAEYKAIVKAFEDAGNTVISDNVFKVTDENNGESDSVSSDLQSTDNTGGYFKQIRTSIERSDLVVIEATRPTDNIKYEIEYALKMKKPVYIMYSSEKSEVEDYSVEASPNKSIVIYEYNSENVFDRVQEIIESARDNYEEVICVKLDRYLGDKLTKMAVEKGVSKTQLVKTIIRNHLFNRGNELEKI